MTSMMTIKASSASNGLDLIKTSTNTSTPPMPPTPPKSEAKNVTRLAFSVDSLLSSVKAVHRPQKEEVEEDLEDEELDVEDDDDEDLEDDEGGDEERHQLAHPRPLFGGQPPFLAAGLAAMAAAAAASGKNPSISPSQFQQMHTPVSSANGLFPGLGGWQPPPGLLPPGFPHLGFPGFQHPLFKPGTTFFRIKTINLPLPTYQDQCLELLKNQRAAECPWANQQNKLEKGHKNQNARYIRSK